MARTTVPVTGAVLKWAIEESELTVTSLAEKLKVEPSAVIEWIEEDSGPSKGQLTALAKLLHRPSSFFYLPEPPERRSVPTAFRRAPGPGRELSAKEVTRIRWARSVQDLLSWVSSREADSRAPAMRRYPIDADPRKAGESERATSGVSLATQRQWGSAYEAFRTWLAFVESTGTTVMQLDLGQGGLRGFSAFDELTPLAVVNTASSAPTRCYTLMHEYGHLLTRTDMACAAFIGPTGGSAVERWCERFAASFLLPTAELRADLGSAHVRTVDEVRLLASRYKVSARAMAIRLQDIGAASSGLYDRVDSTLGNRDWIEGGGGSGETSPEKRVRQLGRRPVEALLEAYERGDLTRLDVQRHLRLDDRGVDEVGQLVRSGARS